MNRRRSVDALIGANRSFPSITAISFVSREILIRDCFHHHFQPYMVDA
jgi:hypothetical protein